VSVLALGAALVMSAFLIRGITAPLDQAVQAADRVAEGDLSQAIHSDSQDETGQLLSALARMQTSLVGTVSNVRDGAESVATASAKLLRAMPICPRAPRNRHLLWKKPRPPWKS